LKGDTKSIRDSAEGDVELNDGEFAKIQTDGIYGLEEGVLFLTLEIQRDETRYTPDEFELRFPAGSSVKIQFTTKITAQPGRKSTSAAVPGTNLHSRSRGKRKVSFRIVDDISQKLTLD
jgi:hypothetical protein